MKTLLFGIMLILYGIGGLLIDRLVIEDDWFSVLMAVFMMAGLTIGILELLIGKRKE